MKKRIISVFLVLACLLVLAGCGCKHEWNPATCDAPAVCSLCGETEGSPNGHSWLAATCSAPKTCEICGEVTGEALSHDWIDATCSSPKTCEICGEVTGEALNHDWIDATYEAPKTCAFCGATEGEPLAKTDSFTSSLSYATVREIINANMSDMAPEFVFDSESGILFIYVTAPEGTAYSLVMNVDGITEGWAEIRTSMCNLSLNCYELFCAEGYDDIYCCIMLRSDANAENVLLGVMNGETLYDCTTS